LTIPDRPGLLQVVAVNTAMVIIITIIITIIIFTIIIIIGFSDKGHDIVRCGKSCGHRERGNSLIAVIIIIIIITIIVIIIIYYGNYHC